MNRQRSTVNNSNGIFFYLEVPNTRRSIENAIADQFPYTHCSLRSQNNIG
ncbi:hypothetical protein LC613_08310 [Nostoc sphaeroides CHAB 2801]|nr:hypothetical protein [Nostoc sphaeroides]MCC5628126.1 hypothetical protein [Nostoc sphaeroides CHAB 2801]